MEKYNVTSKGKKTLFCTYYNATNTLTNTQHTIQKLSRRQDWTQVLVKKDILLMKQNELDCLPSIVEAVQEEGKFFIVLTDQLGVNVDDLRKKKLQLEQIVKIGIRILESIEKLNESGVDFYDIRPEFFFWNQSDSTIKVTYAPTKQQSFLKGMNGELSDIRHHSPETVLQSLLDELSSVFSTGLLMVELICGQTIIGAKHKLDYIYCLAQLFPKQHHKAGETLESKLLRYCSKDLTTILISMMNPQRQKRLKLKQSLDKLQNIDASSLMASSSLSHEKSRSQIPSQTSKLKLQKSQVSHNPSHQESNISHIIEPVTQKLPTEVLQQIKTTSITFNFNFPPENPPILQLVQQLKITSILKKETNVADDVAIATIISEKKKTQPSNYEEFEFEIPQQTVAPQLTVFAKQQNDEEDVFNIPGLSEEDDNGLFQII